MDKIWVQFRLYQHPIMRLPGIIWFNTLFFNRDNCYPTLPEMVFNCSSPSFFSFETATLFYNTICYGAFTKTNWTKKPEKIGTKALELSHNLGSVFVSRMLACSKFCRSIFIIVKEISLYFEPLTDVYDSAKIKVPRT